VELGQTTLEALRRIGLAMMHAFILWRLTASFSNPQVWPWNACCLISVLLLSVPLSWTRSSSDAPQIVTKKHRRGTATWAKAVVGTLFGVGPALHVIGLDWDSYASFSVYSSEIESVRMRLAPSPRPLSSTQFAALGCSMVDAEGFLDYDGWLKASHGFYSYPAFRIFLWHGQWLATHLGVDVDVAVLGRPGNLLVATMMSIFVGDGRVIQKISP